MGSLAQSLLASGPRLDRRGIALPSAMLALIAIGVLLAGLFVMSDLSAKAVKNREASSRAINVAESGVSHALALLRVNLRAVHYTRILQGSDNLANTADDTVLVGWGLVSSDEIPLSGRTTAAGTYFVHLFDDPADPNANPKIDANGRLLVRCRAVTPEGSVAEVEAIVGAIPYPGVVVNGNASFTGGPDLVGACGGVHANGNLSLSNNTILGTQGSATGTVTGNPQLDGGGSAPTLSNQPPLAIPNVLPTAPIASFEHCAGADYILRSDGQMWSRATGLWYNAAGIEQFGWRRSSGPPNTQWQTSGTVGAWPGTRCVEGNVELAGSPGTSVTPLAMSVIATGSIEVSGTPYLAPSHPDGVLLMSGGDVSIEGNPSGGAINYSGLIYAYSQCEVSGNARVFGSMMCADNPQQPNTTDIITSSVFSGNSVIVADCNATLFNKRRVLYWYQRLGA